MSSQRKQSVASPTPLALTPSSFSFDQVIGKPNQVEPIVQNLRTRRSKTMLSFTLEDFSRIHTQYSDKNRAAFIETPVYSFYENDRIKFQLRMHPSRHSLILDAFYRGSEQSAQLFFDVYLVDYQGKKFTFDFNRKIECQLTPQSGESLGNFVYDRDDLERKREKLFKEDKLMINVEVNATWVDISGATNVTDL